MEIGRAHPEARLLLLAQSLDFTLLDEAGAGVTATQKGDLHVGHDVEQQEAAAFLAVLGQESHAGVHRRAGGPDGDVLPVDRNRARGRRGDAEQSFRDVAASRADEAGEPENLSLAQIERDIAEPAFEGQIAHRQRDVADRHRLLGKHLRDLASDHLLDDVVARDVRGRVFSDEAAVAEHRNLVGDLEQLAHLVGDVDDALALAFERADDLEQVLDLALSQRRRRLVHDQNVGIVGHRLGDLDHLPVGDGEIAHLCFRVDRDVESFEQRLGALAHLVVTNEAEGVERLAPNPDILGHRHEAHQVELLMDHGDAILKRIERRMELDFLALEFERAGIGRVDSGDDLHQRRFAGAVLAHQRVDMAAFQAK